MKYLKIKNIGPIIDIDIELNKLNIFIGPQSSGKSTITKIACFCSWVEKKITLLNVNQELLSKEGAFAEELVRFHKLTGYLQDDSYIYYESDILKIEYHHSEKSPVFTWKKRFKYKKGKISYIPSERNIVATIPNWINIKFIDNSTRSFMSDWDEARNAYKEESPLNILNVGAKYFFDGENDRVIVNRLNKELELTNTSSGLQSLIPLLVLFDYLYDWIYHNENPESVKDIKDKNTTDRELEQAVLNSAEHANIQEAKLDILKRNFKEIHHTSAYLEEPEQNLFPEAQRDLVGELIHFNNLNENHSLTITTHSPYILSSINNLMYAYQAGKKDKQKVCTIISEQNWINYDEVRAYFVSDGMVTSILDDEIKQIKAETIDEVSNILNKEYEDLLEIDN
ncbi:MAG TPA: hypothetical protein DEQ30_04260 [Porphyromonadaceae bacterium]|nr:hypothetical protein [Porphyromonadaceae bacterium]